MKEGWRVRVLDEKSAGTGLFKGGGCDFLIKDYFDYGFFAPLDRCRLPGRVFVAEAGGRGSADHTSFSIGTQERPEIYRMGDATLHVHWRVKTPAFPVSGGRFGVAGPVPGPWWVWIEPASQGKLYRCAEVRRRNRAYQERFLVESPADGRVTFDLVLNDRSIEIIDEERGARVLEHDAYDADFRMTFGSMQTEPSGGEVVSEIAEVFFMDFAYPGPGEQPIGPEDLKDTDGVLCYFVNPATPEEPRHSEGDLINLLDGSLLLIWSNYDEGKGWDGSPACLAARRSRDRGKSWSAKEVLVRGKHGTNVMSASLLRAKNGDLLFAYHDRLPDMTAKGMVLRRSRDDASSWSEPVCITPKNGNRHVANNNGMKLLGDGRIVFACREYLGGIRWPYCLYSDDHGSSWTAGAHVPDPGLPEKLKKAQNVNEPSIAELSDGRLLMTMRSVAGGQFFAHSRDRGETWTKPYLSPLRGACSPAAIATIPGTGDVLAIWTYGFAGRTPLTSTVSSDGGHTWRNLKLIERSRCYGYGYTSIRIIDGFVYLTYMHSPAYAHLERFKVEPGYTDLRLTVLPIEWFYRAG